MSKRKKREGGSEEPKRDHRVHPETTINGLRYLFVDKHHYPPKGDHGCWLPSITRDEEFGLFNEADRLRISDEDENLYNIGRANGRYRPIGTRGELIAIFWNPWSAAEWHGHPIWPIETNTSLNRKSEPYRPSVLVLERMKVVHGMSDRDCYRLRNGKRP